jgi:hypothetical protein
MPNQALTPDGSTLPETAPESMRMGSSGMGVATICARAGDMASVASAPMTKAVKTFDMSIASLIFFLMFSA